MPTFDLIKPQYSIERIMERLGQSVVLVRGSTNLPAQTVIIVEISTSASAVIPAGPAGRGGEMLVVLIGYYGHPGKTDIDVAIGDRWSFRGSVYEVVGLNDTVPNRREAKMKIIR